MPTCSPVPSSSLDQECTDSDNTIAADQQENSPLQQQQYSESAISLPDIMRSDDVEGSNNAMAANNRESQCLHSSANLNGGFKWENDIHSACNERTAGCRSEMGRKCYSLPNRYKGSCNTRSNTCASLLCSSTRYQQLLPLSNTQQQQSHSTPPNSSHNSLSNGVSHQLFQKRLASIVSWYGEFSDVQRNRVLSDILSQSRVSQVHLLSLWLCGDGAPSSTAAPYTSNGSVRKHNNSASTRNKNLGISNAIPSNSVTSSALIAPTLKNGTSSHSSLQTATPSLNSTSNNSNGVPNFHESPNTKSVISMHMRETNRLSNNLSSCLNDGQYYKQSNTGHDSSSSTSSCSDSNEQLFESDSFNKFNVNNIEPGASRLHLGCQPNCQDPLTILPTHVSHIILSFLDPPSLAKAQQVSRLWHWICSSSILWKRLSLMPCWKLSPEGHQIQLAKHTYNSTVDWKEVMVERYRVRRNWLGAHCHVRTFSGHTGGVTCVQFDQHRIVSASHDSTIKVWSMRTNSQWPVQTLLGHSGRVRCLHLSNNRLVSGATDATIKVWDVEETSAWSSIVCRVTMVGHTATVRCLQVYGDDLVVSGSYDCSVKVWKLPSGHCERTLLGHDRPVYSLAVVQELALIVSGSDDNTIKVWDLSTGHCLRTLRGHTGAVTSLSADIHGIISGSIDCTIRSWDLQTGECRNKLDWITSEGHTGVVRCVAANESKVVTASDDKTIKVWERSSLRRMVTLRNHTDGVTCLAFNEFLIVSGSYDTTVKLWDFSVC